MRPKLLTAVAAAAVLLSTLAGTSAQADHAWGGYHWARTANPFNLQLGDNVTATWQNALEVASADWNESTVLTTGVVPGTVRPKNCRAKVGRVEVCNAAYGNNGWLGIASISVTSGNHITAGTVKVNDTYFKTVKYNTPEWRNLVMCQEIGHTFGLDHQDEDFSNPNLGTCMDYTDVPSSNQHPNAHDYEQLETIYAHLDSTTTVAATAGATGAQAGGNTPASWGRAVEGSRAEGHSTYVRSVGNGNYVITFVTWA